MRCSLSTAKLWSPLVANLKSPLLGVFAIFSSHGESAVFGDSAGWGAVAAGLAGLVGGDVEGALAQPPVAAADEAVRVVWAGPDPGRWAVTIFAPLTHRAVFAVGVVRARACFMR